eukprot:scaffold23139_cov54-Isochrysis_galbana.AAC.1
MVCRHGKAMRTRPGQALTSDKRDAPRTHQTTGGSHRAQRTKTAPTHPKNKNVSKEHKKRLHAPEEQKRNPQPALAQNEPPPRTLGATASTALGRQH